MATISGTGANDPLNGTAQDDSIAGGAGDDTIRGDAGDDTLYGGEGNDILYAGDGHDEVYGDAGDDTLHGGGDNDDLYGGDGNDLFDIDTLGSAGVTNTTVYGGSGTDVLNISALLGQGYEINSLVKNPADAPNSYNGQIELYNPSTGAWANINFNDIEQIVICFAAGTRIATPCGERLVEELRPGDRVITRDNGTQTIRWSSSRALDTAHLSAHRDHAPILIRQGSLGGGRPERDLLVSPNHRMLVISNEASLLFGSREVLVPAKHLVGRPGVLRATTDSVTYVHFLCDRHEVVLANGAWSESFQPGDQAMRGLEAEQQRELFALFPELAEVGATETFAAARRTLKRHEARLLAV